MRKKRRVWRKTVRKSWKKERMTRKGFRRSTRGRTRRNRKNFLQREKRGRNIRNSHRTGKRITHKFSLYHASLLFSSY